MKIKSLAMAALALVGASTLALGANAQERLMKPGGNWAGMLQASDGGHLFGNPEAEKKLIEFMSYTCSHCAEFARKGDAAIKLSYVPTGKISYEVRHLIRDPVDLTAALLTHCGDEKKFGGNHEAIMYRFDEWMDKARNATQAQRSRWQFGTNSARFQAIASDLDFYEIMETRGYRRADLDRCLSDEAKAKALADTSAADVAKYQLTGTPSFVLDGKLLEAHDWPSLEKRLKDAI
ncbi:MAG: thioredoxin domain-containing protein [Pseudomonadota bacterium]|uniref:DsbA family protein n=1 Tax=Qipengyuania pacifica TaxID=2860199 RepID=A0ABS7JE13_9SPHN|nr:thioredoxin domain-containing protein [Erythrobacter sp. SAORIC-644]MAB45738.1 protein-disulfide isomerase [Sphingomonadaceae bacterium]MBL4895925.1 thioredoxin domain-containing protein [Erythrobacter sp.]MBX7488260.1 DsbA family protein [Qipengyuania aerophila]MBY8332692.1 DsbA family protein [Qipengyuania pacifica]MEC7951511.1 thioredoxin domain-containing protein [Pseudomonadota bacterium]QPL39191.1 thioredoxin domain-containing protein [Erythrobacter sp. A30-3]